MNLDLDDEKKAYYAFVPNLGDEYAVWCGAPTSQQQYQEKTGASNVYVYLDVINIFSKVLNIVKICMKLLTC